MLDIIKERLAKIKKWLLSIAAIILLVIVGTAIYFSTQKMNEISKEEATSAVASIDANYEILSFNRDWEWQWSQPSSLEMIVKTNDGYEEITLNGSSGDIIERTVISNFDQANIISVEEAIETATEQVDGTIKEIELELDDNVLIYDIEIESDKKDYDVKIDAITGALIKVGLS